MFVIENILYNSSYFLCYGNGRGVIIVDSGKLVRGVKDFVDAVSESSVKHSVDYKTCNKLL